MTYTGRTVAEAWARFVEASQVYDVAVKQNKRPDQHDLKKVFEAAESVLRAHASAENFPTAEIPKEQFPKGLAELIANQIAYIRNGKLPDPIKDMLQRSSPGIGPIEAVDIEVAVAYIRGVRAKLFKSKHPVKDVSKYCGVTSRTVSNWQKRLGSVEPSDLYFNIDGLGPEEDPLKILTKAGFRYKRAGRSSVGRAEHSL